VCFESSTVLSGCVCKWYGSKRVVSCAQRLVLHVSTTNVTILREVRYDE
jgi:hypothetical protein